MAGCDAKENLRSAGKGGETSPAPSRETVNNEVVLDRVRRPEEPQTGKSYAVWKREQNNEKNSSLR